MVDFPLVPDHFAGGANLTPQGQADLRDIINQLAFENVHAPIVAPGKSDGPPGLNPEIAIKDALAYLVFTLNTDSAYRIFKIPRGVQGAVSMHAHWTKSQDTDQSGKAVRWRITYKVFNGFNEDGAGAGATFDFDDTYDDAGTVTRIVHHSPNVVLGDLAAGYYLSVKVEAVTPPGSALVDPGLVALDITYQTQKGLL